MWHDEKRLFGSFAIKRVLHEALPTDQGGEREREKVEGGKRPKAVAA